MSDPVILNNSQTPFGRYRLVKGGANPGMFLVIESIENEGRDSFWLPVKRADGGFVAYLKFVRSKCADAIDVKDQLIADSPVVFLLNEVRPVNCPVQYSEVLCTRSSDLQLEEI